MNTVALPSSPSNPGPFFYSPVPNSQRILLLMEADYLALIEEHGREVWRPVSYCHKVDPANRFVVVTVLDGPRANDTVQVPVHNLRSPDVFTALGEPLAADAWALP